MISRIKKIQFVCMCILLLLVVMGCQIKRTDNNSGNNNVGLIKNEVDLPTGYISVFSIETKSENELYVVLGTDAGESSVYILNIVDGSWTLYQDVKELLENIDYSDYFVSVSKNGEIFICCSKNNNETGAVVSTQKYYIFDKKDVREVKIDLQPLEEGNADEFAEALGIDSSKVTNVITSILTEENVFYLTDINGYLYKINEEANENSLVYKCEQKIGDIRSILQKNDDLVILYSNGVATFNISSGKIIDSDMEKGIASAIDGNVGLSSIYFDECDDGNSVFLLCGDNIFSVNADKSKQYAKLNGLNTNTNNFLTDFACCNDNTFFIINYDYTKNERKLFCYSDKEIPSESAKKTSDDKLDTKKEKLSGELKVWVLRDNWDVNILINSFASEFSNVNVSVEVGLANDSGLTVTDAIKNLNADLLTGNGPDVIFMDQINIEKYIDNGLLMDLTELVGEIENKNNVFSNIIRSVEGEEGIYAIPTRFSLIGQTGTKEKIEVSTDIASWVESLEKDDDKPIIDSYQVESVVQNLLYVSYEEWIKDGSIDENKVDEFVTTVLKLCDCTGKKKLNLGSEISEPETTVNYYDVGCGTYEMVYDYIVSYGYQVQGIRAVADAINGDYKIPANGFEGTYIPSNLLGINSKSKNIEIANEFVNLLFSEEIQSISNGRGMPLNIDAFISDMYCEIKGEVEYKEGVMLNFVDFSDAETRDTINMIKKLNKPIIRDGIMLDIVYEALAQCVEGKISKDEAVRNISEKVMLYISEQ